MCEQEWLAKTVIARIAGDKKINTEASYNGLTVGYFYGGDFMVSLHWLREAGFRGKVSVYNGQFLEEKTPLFEKEIE
jgi:hypothetical protein